VPLASADGLSTLTGAVCGCTHEVTTEAAAGAVTGEAKDGRGAVWECRSGFRACSRCSVDIQIWGGPREGERILSGGGPDVATGGVAAVAVSGSAATATGVAAVEGGWPTRSRFSRSGRTAGAAAAPLCALACGGNGTVGGLCTVLLARGAAAAGAVGGCAGGSGCSVSCGVGSSGAEAEGRLWVSGIGVERAVPPAPGAIAAKAEGPTLPVYQALLVMVCVGAAEEAAVMSMNCAVLPAFSEELAPPPGWMLRSCVFRSSFSRCRAFICTTTPAAPEKGPLHC
jgi:hypothetical protein